MGLFDRFRGRDAGHEATPSSPEANDTEIESVEGERGVSAVQRPPSLQSRLSNFLALGLMGTLGVGLLGWYYAHTLGTRSTAHSEQQSVLQKKANADTEFR